MPTMSNSVRAEGLRREFAYLALVLTCSLVAVGCGGDGLSSVARSVGLADVPPLSPEVIDIACDLSVDTPCTATTLATTLDCVLPYAAIRPETHVRLYGIGRDVSDITMVAEQVVPRMRSTKKKALKRERLAWIDAASRVFAAAAEPMLRQRRVTRSPLFEGASRVALAEVPGITQRVLVYLTDGLQFSELADWECGDVDPGIVARLHHERVLPPGSLKDTRVFLSFASFSQASKGRCRSSISRITTITDAWRRILREAGASDVTVSSGVAPLGDHGTS